VLPFLRGLKLDNTTERTEKPPWGWNKIAAYRGPAAVGGEGGAGDERRFVVARVEGDARSRRGRPTGPNAAHRLWWKLISSWLLREGFP